MHRHTDGVDGVCKMRPGAVDASEGSFALQQGRAFAGLAEAVFGGFLHRFDDVAQREVCRKALRRSGGGEAAGGADQGGFIRAVAEDIVRAFAANVVGALQQHRICIQLQADLTVH